MGLIERLFDAVFGGGRNVVVETAEVFRENAEAASQRGSQIKSQTLAQFAAEFAQPRKGWFDRFIDGLNRLPRPALAFGTLGLFVTAMSDPVWFASRMQGIALVPDPLWWLMGAIVSFYFGARHQEKTQDFQRSIAETVSRTPQVAASVEALEALRIAPLPDLAPAVSDNPALAEWQRRNS